MKIAFDVSQTGFAKAGCGFFSDSLIRSLERIDARNGYRLLPTFGDLYWDPQWDTATFRTDNVRFSRVNGHGTLEESRRFWAYEAGEFESRAGHPDIVHSNNFFCPFGIERARLVYTLHDLGFLENPRWTTEENRIGCFTGVFRASVCADRILAVSHFTRNHFLEHFPHYPSDRIDVVYEGSRFSFREGLECPAKFSDIEPEAYWFHLGTLEPRKNQLYLLEALALLRESGHSPFPLILAGGEGWLMDDFRRRIEDLELADQVRMLGYLEGADLQWLLQNCFAFVFPSHFEGFGLPLLEAMSCGSAVIASRNTAMPEVVGEAGILVDSSRPESLAGAMQSLLRNADLRSSLRARALERARTFSWDKTAARVLKSYEIALAAPRLT